jgi:hypothetical protein
MLVTPLDQVSKTLNIFNDTHSDKLGKMEIK